MPKTTKSKYYWGITVGIIMIAVLFGCFKLKGNTSVQAVPEDIPLVKTQIISSAAGDQNYTYSGEVRGRYESQLAFQTSGKIIRRNVEPGSLVNKGEALIQIDPVDIRQGVDARQAQVAAAESQFKLAKDNLERFKEIYRQQLMSKAEFDRYQAAYDAAESQLRQAKAQFTQGANQLNYCNVYADSDGVVAAVNAETGQVVAAGQPVVVLVKGSEREIEINVPENRLSELYKGQRLQVTFWALPNVTVEGLVREISPVADKQTRTYRVRVSMQNPPAAVKLGMTATVTANDSSSENEILVPVAAIYQTNNNANLWVVERGVVHLQAVKLGEFGEDDQVRVLEGIKVGERIVTAGTHKLRQGVKVKIGVDGE